MSTPSETKVTHRRSHASVLEEFGCLGRNARENIAAKVTKGMMRGLAAFGIDFGLGDGGLGAGDGLAAFVAGDAFGTRAAAGAFFEGGALWGVAATDDFLPCDVLLDGTCSGHLHSLPSSANCASRHCINTSRSD